MSRTRGGGVSSSFQMKTKLFFVPSPGFVLWGGDTRAALLSPRASSLSAPTVPTGGPRPRFGPGGHRTGRSLGRREHRRPVRVARAPASGTRCFEGDAPD